MSPQQQSRTRAGHDPHPGGARAGGQEHLSDSNKGLARYHVEDTGFSQPGCVCACACVPRWECAPLWPCVCVCPLVGVCSHVCMCVPMCACVPVWECAPMRSCVFPCVHVSLCGTVLPHVCSHVCSPTSPCVRVCAQTRIHMPTGAQGDEEAVASTHAGARFSLHPCAEEPDISLSKPCRELLSCSLWVQWVILPRSQGASVIRKTTTRGVFPERN